MDFNPDISLTRSKVYIRQTFILPAASLKNTSTAPLQRGKMPPNECPDIGIKHSDGEARILKLLEILTTPFQLLPGPL